MICKWCNKEVQENSKFCTHCGGNLQNQVNEPVVNANSQIVEEPIVPVQQPVAPVQPVEMPAQEPVMNVVNNVQPQTETINEQEGKANVGLVILSVLIPIAGLIIFLVKKDSDKKTAKASGIAALISFGVSILVTIISVVAISLSAKNIIDDAIDSAQDYEIIEDDETQVDDSYYDEDDNDNEADSGNSNISTEWKNYQFTVNNKTLSLPATYSDLSSATSSEMQSSYTKSYLQSGYYAIINMYKNDKLTLYTEVLNDTEQDMLYTDCKITRVSQTKNQVSVYGADAITFPGGLKAGQEITETEIINLFGTPDDTYNYESDGYISNTYTYLEDSYYTTMNYYKINVVNGVIDELTLDNRDYD